MKITWSMEPYAAESVVLLAELISLSSDNLKLVGDDAYIKCTGIEPVERDASHFSNDLHLRKS